MNHNTKYYYLLIKELSLIFPEELHDIFSRGFIKTILAEVFQYAIIRDLLFSHYITLVYKICLIKKNQTVFLLWNRVLKKTQMSPYLTARWNWGCAHPLYDGLCGNILICGLAKPYTCNNWCRTKSLRVARSMNRRKTRWSW